MSDIGVKLQEARILKGLTLEQVSSSVRIDKKYLQAIEEGKPIDLPELYQRAFIKDYAEFLQVELPSVEQHPKPEAMKPMGRIDSTVSSQVTTTNLPGSTAIKYPSSLPLRKGHQFRTLALFSIILLLGFIALMYYVQGKKTASSTQEVKFTDVVRTWESKNADSSPSPFLNGATDSIRGIDTLILEGAAVESVWVRVVIDGMEIKEYTLPPLGRIRCEGRQYFELSLDNARGIIFSFNGERIGTLSQIKKPLWNVTVSPTTIEHLKKMATGNG